MVEGKEIKANHPIQPFVTDEHGAIRFKKNTIVNFLLENGGYDLNKLCIMDFPQEDWEQFMQLIGYSFSGFSELSEISNKTYGMARTRYNNYLEKYSKK